MRKDCWSRDLSITIWSVGQSVGRLVDGSVGQRSYTGRFSTICTLRMWYIRSMYLVRTWYSTWHVVQYMLRGTVHVMWYSTCYMVQYMLRGTVRTWYMVQYMVDSTVRGAWYVCDTWCVV